MTHLAFMPAELPEHVSIAQELYRSLALTVHDCPIERRDHAYNASDVHAARCIDHLMGRTLGDSLAPLGCLDVHSAIITRTCAT